MNEESGIRSEANIDMQVIEEITVAAFESLFP
jgi:hypothetical protein